MASPLGSSHGASGQLFITVAFLASILVISLLSSIFTKTPPLPSATPNSGLPSSGILATTLSLVASITVAFLLRTLKVKTR
jgi:hypothetical protein